MATVREIISEVRNNLRAVSIDEWIPAKYIHMKLLGFASLFIKREADDRRLFRYSNMYTPIRCFDMIEKDLIECCDESIPGCTKVMRSKHKLPKIYSTRYGYLITITALDYDRDYNFVTPAQYKYIKSRKFQDKSKRYFWITDNYVVVPDSFVSSITVNAAFINRAEAKRLECGAEETCYRLMDEDIIIPEHLIQDVKNATTADLMNTYMRFQPDELANLNSLEKSNQQP